MYDKEAPGEWNFAEYNSDRNKPKILEWLKESGAHAIRIPYRANRAVVFNSDLVRNRRRHIQRRLPESTDQHHAALWPSSSSLIDCQLAFGSQASSGSVLVSAKTETMTP